MNFFSHAVVAHRFSDAPEFVLGAMLPDFASMLGVRLGAVQHPALERGVRFHHLTDRVFHGLFAFELESRDALRELRALGVAKGPARAVAHVGVEILLDVTLGQSASAQSAYLSGLAAGRRPEVIASVSWPDEARERLRDLLETLDRRGIVLDSSSPRIVERIRRTLARRPRLALDDGDSARVLTWVEGARGRVVTSAPALVAALHAELDRRFTS